MSQARQVVDVEPLLSGLNNSSAARYSYHTLMNHKHHRPTKMRAPTKSTKFWTLTIISLLLLGLFAWALYCRLVPVPRPEPTFTSHLKLVTLLIRHADRAPSDNLPPRDRHSEKPLFFWPNGLTNLTDTGRLRAYRTGVALRRQYGRFLDYSPDSVLAFSSPVYRCVESSHYLLRGLFDSGRSMQEASQFYSRLNRCSQQQSSSQEAPDALGELEFCSAPVVRGGSGANQDWRGIVIDSETLASLSIGYMSSCRLLANVSLPVDQDALLLEPVRQLQGIKVLEKVLRDRYNYTKLTFDALTVLSTIKSELELVRTSTSLRYADHFQSWIWLEASRRISGGGGAGCGTRAHVISLFDLLERVTVVVARERLTGLYGRLTVGPILESIVRAQAVALGAAPAGPIEERYRDRKLVVYYSHDTIIQRLLWELGVCHDEPYESYFEDQFHRHFSEPTDTTSPIDEQQQELAPFLAGLKMSNYGLSVELELWELVDLQDAAKKFHTIQMNIYNRDDGKFRPVDHRPVALGAACRRLFLQKYPAGNLATFYDEPHFGQLDKSLSCPLSLFRNVTADLLVEPATFRRMCD